MQPRWWWWWTVKILASAKLCHSPDYWRRFYSITHRKEQVCDHPWSTACYNFPCLSLKHGISMITSCLCYWIHGSKMLCLFSSSEIRRTLRQYNQKPTVDDTTLAQSAYNLKGPRKQRKKCTTSKQSSQDDTKHINLLQLLIVNVTFSFFKKNLYWSHCLWYSLEILYLD